jgi:DNA-binding transcriptional LysR family regulator
MANCASPGYLARHGTPLSLDDLAQHRLVHFVSTLGAKSSGFEYTDGQDVDQALSMAGSVTVNNAEAYQAACLVGLGLIQAPRAGVRELLAQGQLVEVLPQYQARPMPLSLVYANRRNLSARVRVVMDWLCLVIGEYLAP